MDAISSLASSGISSLGNNLISTLTGSQTEDQDFSDLLSQAYSLADTGSTGQTSDSTSSLLGDNAISSVTGSQSSDGSNFSSIGTESYDLANSTEATAQSSLLDLLSGNIDDPASVMIDSEKSQIALSLTVQIRNKVIESYKEIMSMQV